MDTKLKDKTFIKYLSVINNILIIVLFIVSIIMKEYQFIGIGCMLASLAILAAKVFYGEFKLLMLIYSLDKTIEEMGEDKTSINSVIKIFSTEFPENFKNDKGIYESIAKISGNVRDYVQNKSRNEQTINRLISNVVNKLDKPISNLEDGVKELRNGNGNLDDLYEEGLFTKKLIDDLFESSKATSGTLGFNKEIININYMLKQAIAEFSTGIQESKLNYETTGLEESVFIVGDPEKLWRVFQIILENTLKHSLEGTRVYVDSITDDKSHEIIIKSISKNPLNIKAEELYKRIESCEDEKCTGLPLETTRSIITGLDGKFELRIDGDLFKTVIRFNKEGDSDVSSRN